MTPTTTLLEPSFVDLIAAIEQAAELSEQRRRHWVCSLRQIAKWLDRPAAVIPARFTAVQMPLGNCITLGGRCHGEDPGEPQVQSSGGPPLVRQGARRAAARAYAYRRSGRGFVTGWMTAYGTGSTA